MALKWLNHNLASKEIVVEDIYTSIRDGLNLIYALEHVTGEKIGKYNKRVMMDVQRSDNLAVAFKFLIPHGVPSSLISPVDVLNGNKGKILALYGRILKVFPPTE